MIKTSKQLKLYAYLGFLIIVLAYVVIQLYIKSHLPTAGWTISDWLINYEDGGFKRRGLFGSFFLFVQDHLNIQLHTQVFLVQSLFFILVFYFLIRLILSKKLNWDILILLCSPLCILYLPVNIFNSGRKEIILLALLLYFASGEITRMKKILLFTGFLLGLFIHELFYFYLPFVIAVYVLKTKKIDLKYLGSLTLLSTLIMIVLFFFGGEINQGQSIELLKTRGIELDKWNIFTYNSAEERENMIIAYKSYILFAAELFLMIFLSFSFIKKYLPEYKNAFRLFIIISLAWVSPLYYLGADWFRWNHIYSLSLISLIISTLPNNTDKRFYVDGKFNISLFLIIILFFIIFYLHIQYDTSGNSEEYLMDYIKTKLHL